MVAQKSIRIDKTSRVTVVIPAVQIVKPEVIIIVIAPVRKRVILRRCRGSAIGVCYREVAPCVVDIACQLHPSVIVYGNHVSLQVLLKPEGIKDSLRIAFIAVLHPCRQSIVIVQIDERFLPTYWGRPGMRKSLYLDVRYLLTILIILFYDMS